MPRPNMRRRVDAAIKAATHLHDKDAGAIQTPGGGVHHPPRPQLRQRDPQYLGGR